jgi:hypothetical protein
VAQVDLVAVEQAVEALQQGLLEQLTEVAVAEELQDCTPAQLVQMVVQEL